MQRISGLDRNARLCSKTAEVNGTLWGWGVRFYYFLSGWVPDEYCRMGIDVGSGSCLQYYHRECWRAYIDYTRSLVNFIIFHSPCTHRTPGFISLLTSSSILHRFLIGAIFEWRKCIYCCVASRRRFHVYYCWLVSATVIRA